MASLTLRAREPAAAGTPRGEPGLADVLRTTAADLLSLGAAELKLIRLEVASSLREQAGRAAWLAAGALPAVAGYVCAVAALAVWLTPRWGLAGALGATAALQVVLSCILLGVASNSRGRARVKGALGTDEGESDPEGPRQRGGAGALRA